VIVTEAVMLRYDLLVVYRQARCTWEPASEWCLRQAVQVVLDSTNWWRWIRDHRQASFHTIGHKSFTSVLLCLQPP